MDRAINVSGHGNNVVDGLNVTDKRYLKYQMEIIGKFVRDDTTNIGIFPNALKYIFIKFANHCLHIINNKEILKEVKVITNMQNRESLFKYQSSVYNVQRNSAFNHIYNVVLPQRD